MQKTCPAFQELKRCHNY